MTYLRLPLQQRSPWYQFSVTLSGQVYVLEVTYNTRMDRWLLDVCDAAGEPILVGAPLLLGRDILGQYPTLPLPPGLLFVADDDGSKNNPGLTGFLSGNSLLYADSIR